jgi:hypothetical protein
MIIQQNFQSPQLIAQSEGASIATAVVLMGGIA